MRLVSNKVFPVALLGLGLFATGFVWMEIWLYWAKRNDPPGWIIDRQVPLAPLLVAKAGVLIFLGCLAFTAVKGIYTPGSSVCSPEKIKLPSLIDGPFTPQTFLRARSGI